MVEGVGEPLVKGTDQGLLELQVQSPDSCEVGMEERKVQR